MDDIWFLLKKKVKPRTGSSRSTDVRRNDDFTKMCTIFSNESPDQHIQRWMAHNKYQYQQYFINYANQQSQVSPSQPSSSKPQKLSAQECMKLQLWADISDEQWDSMKRGLRLCDKDCLYSAKQIRNLVGKNEQVAIQQELDVHELSTSPGGVYVNIKKTLVWLLLTLSPSGASIPENSLWKIMIDGRPKGTQFKFNNHFSLLMKI